MLTISNTMVFRFFTVIYNGKNMLNISGVPLMKVLISAVSPIIIIIISDSVRPEEWAV